MRDFDTELQKALNGDESVDAMLTTTQATWKKAF